MALLLPGRNVSGQSIAARMLVLLPVVGCVAALGIYAVLGTNDTAPDTFGGWEEGTHEEFPRTIEDAVRKIDTARRDLAQTDSGYLPETRLQSISDIILFAPKGTLYFLSVPWPWQLGSVRQTIAIPDTLLWVVIFYPVFLIGLPKLAVHEPGGTFLLLIPAVAMCCLYGVFLGNIGTVYRMRVQVWILLLPVVAVGWEVVNRRPPFAMNGRLGNTLAEVASQRRPLLSQRPPVEQSDRPGRNSPGRMQDKQP